MNLITVSREFGAGGGEVARRLAERLGWELLDRELLHQAAAVEHMPDAELAALDEKALGLADRLRLHPPHHRYVHGLRQAARDAAGRGNVVLVGRGTSHLLGDVPGAFHLRLVAPLPWRAARMAELEEKPVEEMLARCAQVDQTRERFMRYFFGDAPGRPENFDLVVNTGRVPLEDVVGAVVACIGGEPGALAPGGPTTSPGGVAGPRVLTVAREMAAGDAALVPALAERLGLQVYDREFLEQEARHLGLTAEEIRRMEDQPQGMLRGLRPDDLRRRYVEFLGRHVAELAARGDMLLVGRGGNRILADNRWAVAVRLVAPMADRVRRVMEHHWIREEPARKLLAQSDTARQSFYSSAFGGDWANPLDYHATVNAGRLGERAGDMIALLAGRHWQRAAAGEVSG